MRKTKLMEISERAGGSSPLYGDTRLIDATVYMLADMAEGEFGSRLIEKLEEDILFTQVGHPIGNTLQWMTQTFFTDYVYPYLQPDPASRLRGFYGLGPLSEETHADYFSMLIRLEMEANLATEEGRALRDLHGILSGYATHMQHPVCKGLMTYFTVTQDMDGLIRYIRSVCGYLKKQVQG